MKKIFLALFVFGFFNFSFSQVIQEEKLEEVVVTAVNYKYVSSVTSEDIAFPVKLLERKAASWNPKESDLYDDEYDFYTISFFIPEGKIVAAYDKEGKILRTIEKFKNVKLPKVVSNAIVDRFPGWDVIEDVYLVKYNDKKGTSKKYKVRLQNGDQVIKVKMDAEGNFL
ncbi:nicotinate-nucleotide adenylyltransferase [Ascidiimonas sp. W6]|uniref:nicotinate-nucleotide adenylyltransferase n=1 Tax=Ascidiimonas meishanensis TaxID=3128903 RepID=UPI0030ED0619